MVDRKDSAILCQHASGARNWHSDTIVQLTTSWLPSLSFVSFCLCLPSVYLACYSLLKRRHFVSANGVSQPDEHHSYPQVTLNYPFLAARLASTPPQVMALSQAFLCPKATYLISVFTTTNNNISKTFSFHMLYLYIHLILRQNTLWYCPQCNVRQNESHWA